MKKLLLLSLFVAGTSLNAVAQTKAESKWNPGVSLFMAKNDAASTLKTRSAAQEPTLSVSIDCTDHEAVVKMIEAAGGCTIIGAFEGYVAAHLTEAAIRQLAESDAVVSIYAARKMRPSISDARLARCGNVDAIHSGSGLEHPFTGKGVVIGVIDQGFEYKHRAFLDENGRSRLLGLWVRNTSSGAANQKYTDPDNIPDTGDGLPTTGHGSHVANIAAGSKYDGCEFYGVAPEADLVFIPSTFEDSEVMIDVKWIQELAEEEGKPWVVNMSFGSHIGPHDGTTLCDTKVTDMCEEGGIVVAAMGNEGDSKIHVQHTFTADGTVTLLLSKGTAGRNNFCIWGATADGKYHLSVKPFYYNTNTKQRDYKNNMYWRNILTSGIDAYNKKENYAVEVDNTAFVNQYIGVEISGKAGDSFHAWSNDASEGEFITDGQSGVLEGNSDYTPGEGSATIPASIAVGAYTSAKNWVSYLNGATYNYEDDNTLTTIGKICSFSSHGPMIGETYAKPTILAPGSAVKSAVSKFGTDFNYQDYTLVAEQSYGGEEFYYAAMAGTSMAAPFVSGVMALWLEAYPHLTYTQAIDVLKSTAKRDTHTGREKGWDALAGYGKIDAYEGLKAVLELAKTDGVNEVLNDEQPVSLSKEDEAWRVLFNTDESYAKVALYDMSGRLVKMQSADSPRRGEEMLISLSDLAAGTYLINVSTTKNSITRKVTKK